MRKPVVLGAIAVAVVLCIACAGIALVAGGFIAFSDGWFGVDSVSDAGRPTPVQVGNPITGTIENIFDANAYSFRAQEGVRYVIETDPEGTSSRSFQLGDSLVGVWDESGENLLTFNDDYGDSLRSRFDWVAPRSGTFLITVENADAISTGDYTLLVSR